RRGCSVIRLHPQTACTGTATTGTHDLGAAAFILRKYKLRTELYESGEGLIRPLNAAADRRSRGKRLDSVATTRTRSQSCTAGWRCSQQTSLLASSQDRARTGTTVG